MGECFATQDPKQLETGRIIHPLLMLNLVAIHAISLTTTEVILDFYSSPNFEGILDGLSEEGDKSLRQYNGKWNSEAVSKLCRLDSIIRDP